MDLPARMDQAGIIDSDDSNIEQARGCKSTGIVKTGMMERTERQVVTILEHGTLDSAHARNPHGGTAPATPRTPRPSHQENRR